MKEVVVLGAGLHPYGIFPEKHFVSLGVEACQRALKDAEIEWHKVDAGYCGSVNLLPGCGHAVALSLGTHGAAIANVENASASGSSAFREAYLAIASGMHDVVIAIGVDKLRTLDEMRRRWSSSTEQKQEERSSPIVESFARLARDYMKQYGTTIDQLAKVSVKSHRNASFNPYAHFQKPVTLEEVHQARMVVEPLTVLHCCPWDEGAAAVVLCAAELRHRFTQKPCPRILASVCLGVTDSESPSDMTALTARTAQRAYEVAGCGPEDLGLVELHDAFTIEELIYSEALGLCAKGEGGHLVESGATEVGGQIPVNTSGGLISMGHPLGPTGLGQIAELLWQMRGQAGGRQIVPHPRVGLAQMVGAGGVCFIHILGL